MGRDRQAGALAGRRIRCGGTRLNQREHVKFRPGTGQVQEKCSQDRPRLANILIERPDVEEVMGLFELLALGGLAVLVAIGVAAVVFLTGRSNRNDGPTHGDGYGGSGSASSGD